MAQENRWSVSHVHIVDLLTRLKNRRTPFSFPLLSNSTLCVSANFWHDYDKKINIINYLNIQMSMRDVFRITKGWLELTGDLLGRTFRI